MLCQKTISFKALFTARDDNLIAEYNLEPFNINVQAAERTLIDKLYALGDYYLCDAVQEHSRHIYDIYKLLGIVELSDELRILAKAVFEEGKGHIEVYYYNSFVEFRVTLPSK